MKEKITVYQLTDLDVPSDKSNILYGTINDVRTWAKNKWKENRVFVKKVMFGIGQEVENEEDFYTKMDDDNILVIFITGSGYRMKPLCDVPFDDFYSDAKPTQELIDEVLGQIKADITDGDLTALDEMLNSVPIERLIGFLPEK